jgi:ATP-dependent RNA helicase RhlE
MHSFSNLGLVEPLQRALRETGYSHPTPIQEQSIPHLLEGRDLLGCARTGTGKTAAFALPILQLLSLSSPPPARQGPGSQGGRSRGRTPRALVLVPTRELASQVAKSFETYGAHLPLSTAVIYGGVGQGPQVSALTRGVDVLVATPGRLLDLMGQGHAKLERIEVLVLDEADHMLDLGFVPDVRRILRAVPKKRQTLLFSATMPPPIANLAASILTSPVEVFVTPAATTVEEVEQRVHLVSGADKPALLAHLLSEASVERALVFTRTKRGADRVTKRLAQSGIPAQAIHGNKGQSARERTLEGFREGSVRVLVATDIAARGLDIDDVSHVFNFELPHVPEVYVHRIGRTARAGATGTAVSLCDGGELGLLKDIERLIRTKLPVVTPPKYEKLAFRAEPIERAEPERGRSRGGGGRSGGRGSERSSGRGRSQGAHAGHGGRDGNAGHRGGHGRRHDESSRPGRPSQAPTTRRRPTPLPVQRAPAAAPKREHGPSPDFGHGL